MWKALTATTHQILNQLEQHPRPKKCWLWAQSKARTLQQSREWAHPKWSRVWAQGANIHPFSIACPIVGRECPFLGHRMGSITIQLHSFSTACPTMGGCLPTSYQEAPPYNSIHSAWHARSWDANAHSWGTVCQTYPTIKHLSQQKASSYNSIHSAQHAQPRGAVYQHPIRKHYPTTQFAQHSMPDCGARSLFPSVRLRRHFTYNQPPPWLFTRYVVESRCVSRQGGFAQLTLQLST